MVFGFNTDVKHQDTIYHVQSEAREADLLLQTAGLCTRPVHWQAGQVVREQGGRVGLR